MHLNNKANAYQKALSKDGFFDKCPKSVFAAIAMSFAMQQGATEASTPFHLLEEWRILHENGIIPQKPPKF